MGRLKRDSNAERTEAAFNQKHLSTWCSVMIYMDFPGGSYGKESTCNTGDVGSIPGSGRSPGEGNGNQYSCLGNPMDRGTMGSQRVRQDLMTKQL